MSRNTGGPVAARACITATAHYAPPNVVENSFFEGHLETTDEWIRTRTGIEERRMATSGGTSDLIVPAALEALEARGLSPSDIDCIIVATITPDRLCPSTAAAVQRKIGALTAWGFDLSAACSGFIYGVVTAAKLVESGAARRVLLCGADLMTSIIDPEDRNTAILFGDGGGVVIIEASDDPEIGIIDSCLRMDGRGEDSLFIPAGGSRMPATAETVANRQHYVLQDGPTVFKAAVSGMSEVTATVMRRNDLTADDIDWFVPHQANIRILQSVGKRLGFEPERVMLNLNRYGNTTGGTIPLCLSEWNAAGRIEHGDRLLLSSFGAGFTMGSVYLRWAIG
ncbi:MAG TPA: beta-ketoacyl-ACP synthase III [Longimicrobiaceae bacterium]|nr:beta-ketoacyl-ACP synthase III [Longimicrobiaceae bacterium]